jgi:hypothetical protein
MFVSTSTNKLVKESTISGTETVTFDLKASKWLITNNSSSHNLQFKYNSTEEYATLLPGETVSDMIRSNTIYIKSPSGNSVSYRIWGYA